MARFTDMVAPRIEAAQCIVDRERPRGNGRAVPIIGVQGRPEFADCRVLLDVKRSVEDERRRSCRHRPTGRRRREWQWRSRGPARRDGPGRLRAGGVVCDRRLIARRFRFTHDRLRGVRPHKCDSILAVMRRRGNFWLAACGEPSGPFAALARHNNCNWSVRRRRRTSPEAGKGPLDDAGIAEIAMPSAWAEGQALPHQRDLTGAAAFGKGRQGRVHFRGESCGAGHASAGRMFWHSHG